MVVGFSPENSFALIIFFICNVLDLNYRGKFQLEHKQTKNEIRGGNKNGRVEKEIIS
jgi:hypothetical protein